jgi:hypothetical protein
MLSSIISSDETDILPVQGGQVEQNLTGTVIQTVGKNLATNGTNSSHG